ncbi:HpcH/HpaI aldolase family protein [Mycobacterium parascrofulaceum]|uniref:HpcH/HpaI aldolase family protein n=1 Tax=Mycobacterium parascrofulaceum TaxID=240125 RepID=UPI00058D805D|nr:MULTISPECIES: aldolase/citrate lyase family protein [Mycobacterium]OCB33902.1 aldolase [Mycobacterium malmoense]
MSATEGSRSPLQRALERATPIWGGWITGPTVLGPDEFARAGYDYVAFDAQHGYLDDADIAGMLRRAEHLPVGTVVRLPDADAAPIGRVLDAGADAVVIAMIESADQAAAAVAATRYQPRGIRSFGPLRASLGRDTAALESRVSVFAMIETAAALSGLSAICAVEGLTGLYVGPADLALSLGVDVVGATKHPAVLDAIVRIHRAAGAAGLVTGIHAGDGTTGRAMAKLGFSMITLTAEAHALRRGAAEHLREATEP